MSLVFSLSPLTLQTQQHHHHSRIQIPSLRSNVSIKPTIPNFRQIPKQHLSIKPRLSRIRSIQQNPEESPPSTVTVTPANPRWESVLSTLASLYPVYVTVGGLVACLKPSTFSWFVERAPDSYSFSLGFIMLSMGLTLEFKDLVNLFMQRPLSIIFGCGCQYTIMPAFGFGISRLLGLSPSLSVGLILLSYCPGGTASNVVVVAPVLVGSYMQSTFPRAVKTALPFAPLIAVLTSSLLACSVFSENVGRLKSSMVLTSLSSDMSPFLYARALFSSEMGMVVLSVLLLHFAGFFVGYLAATIAGFKESERRAVSIEVGMQNSSLGVVLAASHFSSGMVALPPAVSAVIMNIMGSTLGFIWRHVDPNSQPESVSKH